VSLISGGVATRQASRYRLDKQAGKCKSCPAPCVTGAYCTRCHDNRYTYYRDQRAARAAAGRCVNGCEADIVAGRKQCDACLEERARKTREASAVLARAGLCASCRCRSRVADCLYCELCKTDRKRVDAARTRKRRVKPRRIALGFCQECSPTLGRVPEPGLLHCRVCLDRHSADRKRLRHDRYLLGLCADCGLGLDNVKRSDKLCTDCLDLISTENQKQREHRHVIAERTTQATGARVEV
jgi:hypothetical protein